MCVMRGPLGHTRVPFPFTHALPLPPSAARHCRSYSPHRVWVWAVVWVSLFTFMALISPSKRYILCAICVMCRAASVLLDFVLPLLRYSTRKPWLSHRVCQSADLMVHILVRVLSKSYLALLSYNINYSITYKEYCCISFLSYIIYYKYWLGWRPYKTFRWTLRFGSWTQTYVPFGSTNCKIYYGRIYFNKNLMYYNYIRIFIKSILMLGYRQHWMKGIPTSGRFFKILSTLLLFIYFLTKQYRILWPAMVLRVCLTYSTFLLFLFFGFLIFYCPFWGRFCTFVKISGFTIDIIINRCSSYIVGFHFPKNSCVDRLPRFMLICCDLLNGFYWAFGRILWRRLKWTVSWPIFSIQHSNATFEMSYEWLACFG